MRAFAATGVFLTLIHQTIANLDAVTLYAKSDAWIQEASATLVVPDAPNPITGDVALWSAIMMENQASFLQGVTQNSPEGYGVAHLTRQFPKEIELKQDRSGYCTNLGSDWCNFAYTLIGSQVENGTPVKAAAGSRIKTHYKLNSQTQMWDQNLYVNDKLVSSVSTSKGEHGEIFYISVECASGTCATAPAHSWEDVSIILSKADQSFGHSGGWEQGATGGEMSTPDGGKTWNFTTLEVPASNP